MTVHKYLSLSVFSFLVFTNSYSQNKEDKSAAIVKIKKVFQQINSNKKYKIVTIDNSEDFLGHSTDNGGTLTGYYKNDTLKKMVEWAGLSYKIMQNEYYFDNDQLIFVYASESNYHLNDSSQTFDYNKLDPVFAGRYYFDNGKLIDAILSNHNHTTSIKQDAASFIAAAKSYRKLLHAKRK